MKYTRFLAALLAAILMLSLAACGGAPAATGTTPSAQTAAGETAVQDAAYYDEENGLVIRQWTDAFLPYEDQLNIGTQMLDPGKGSYMGTTFFYVMPKPEDPDHLTAVILGSVISSTAPGATTETVWEVIKNMVREDTELEPFTTAYGQTMWLIRESDNLDSLPDEHKTAVTALREGIDEQIAQLEAVKPKLATAAGKVVFTTVDLDGNPVDSSVFANAEYTMINIWGSFCAPCIGEMEDLMKMDAEMDNVQIITILGDATSPDDDTAEDAREVVETLKLTLPVYLTNDEIKELLPSNAFPTSFLVDREGNPLGTSCVGAVGTESYQVWIQNCIGG